MEELVDVLDESGNKTGNAESKRIAHERGLWHSAIHVWIYNSKGQILIQLRCKEKRSHPNMWDVSVGGHVSAGESDIESAVRELKEEIGLKIKAKDLEFYGRKKVSVIVDEKFYNNEFYEVYFLECDKTDGFQLQEEEVAEVKWVDPDLLEREVKENPDKYVPHGDYWLEIIQEVKKRNKRN